VRTFFKFLFPLETKLSKKINLKKRKIVLTISGSSGAGKTTIAQTLSNHFGLLIYNVGDKQRNFAKKRKIALWQSSKILPAKIDYQMDAYSLQLAIKGGYIIVGRFQVAGNWADCRILVFCQQKIRAKRLARKEKISLKQALEKIKSRDRADKERYKRLYNLDISDKKIYNLIIDNTKPSLRRMKKIVIKKVENCLKKNYD